MMCHHVFIPLMRDPDEDETTVTCPICFMPIEPMDDPDPNVIETDGGNVSLDELIDS